MNRLSLALPFVLRALIRGWLRRPPAVRRAPELSGPSPPVTALLHEYPLRVGRRGPHFSGPHMVQQIDRD